MARDEVANVVDRLRERAFDPLNRVPSQPACFVAPKQAGIQPRKNAKSPDVGKLNRPAKPTSLAVLASWEFRLARVKPFQPHHRHRFGRGEFKVISLACVLRQPAPRWLVSWGRNLDIPPIEGNERSAPMQKTPTVDVETEPPRNLGLTKRRRFRLVGNRPGTFGFVKADDCRRYRGCADRIEHDKVKGNVLKTDATCSRR
jgi:hypothetical protein